MTKCAGNGWFLYKSASKKSMHHFHFIGNYSFRTFRTIRVLDAVLIKALKNHSINSKSKPSPMNLWINLHLFEYLPERSQ